MCDRVIDAPNYSYSYLVGAVHHSHKLIKVYFSIAIEIDLADHLAHSVLTKGSLDVIIAEDLLQLLLCYLSISIEVKEPKRSPTNILLNIPITE